MSSADNQLTLDLYNVTRHVLGDFERAGNAECVAAVEQFSAATGARVLYLWGAAGVGKTHLLQAAVEAVGARGIPAMYLPLAALPPGGAALLEDLDAIDVLAIDDIDAVAGDAGWERALFNLYNARQARATRLLWSGTVSPAALGLALPDLVSRVAASLVYQVRELDETGKRAVLAARALARGLDLPPAVTDFILRRERRDLGTLTALLEELDRASLRHGRALTVPFVRELLAARG